MSTRTIAFGSDGTSSTTVRPIQDSAGQQSSQSVQVSEPTVGGCVHERAPRPEGNLMGFGRPSGVGSAESQMEDTDLLAHYESQENWARARRQVLVQRVVCTLKNCSVDLIPFEEVRSRLHLAQTHCRGLQTIDLERIRGSVGRYHDFTSAFLPRRSHLRQRWEQVRAVISARGMPPIEVYQVGDAYFVLDGNHRVSVARQEGMKTIDAFVCEFVTPVGLSAEADLDEVIIKSEYAEFLSHTHLNRMRPEQEIVFTSPGHYRELECLITMFRDVLETTRQEPVSYEDAVLLWFDTVYGPAVHEIRKSGALQRFAGRTEADLFIWMWRHQQSLLKHWASDPPQQGAQALSSFARRLWRRVRRLQQ
jgi:hypothetical protein